MREMESTGRILEREVLGVPEGIDLVEREDTPYQPYRPAMQEIRSLAESKSVVMRDLSASVAKMMGLEPGSVTFHTALGTALDYYHGVDGFFDLKLDEQMHTITIDISFREKEREDYKADVLFYVPDEEAIDYLNEERRTRYTLFLDSVAKKVVESLSLQVGKELGVNHVTRRRRKAA